MAAFGALGVAVLVGLCIWQVQRLAWKEGLIETLEARLAAAPVALPTVFDPERQEFSRVRMAGRFDGGLGAHGYADAPLLTSRKFAGPGYRVIQPFTLADGRRVMVDRGYIPVAEKNARGAASRATPAPEGVVEVIGALRWPDEGGEGPDFGASDNVWTARDLEEMAILFDAEPVLVVLETPTAVGEWPDPEPLRAVAIRNNHLEYAVTWALLALGWAGMTLYLLLRPSPRT